MRPPGKLVVHLVRLCFALALATPAFAQTLDSFNPSPNNVVWSLAVQPDGKVLLGGFFSAIGGQPQNGLGRVNSDGSLDTAFVASTDGLVTALAVQPDGAIIAGGGFTMLGGQRRLRLGRVSADGVVDPNFNPGTDAVVYSLALQPDGKVLVGGFFGNLAGQPRSYLGRLNADGTLDTSFNPGANGGVTSLLVQPDNKILVGGWFTTLAGTNRPYLGRLNADGSIDAAFTAGADNFVNCLALQPDGKILVGGLFTNLAGQVRRYIGRLNPDGTIDNAFNPGANNQVYSFALQTDGSILAGGYFTSLAGTPCNYFGRMNTNGVFDASFNPGAGAQVAALAIQADGKVLVGGWFNSLAGTNRTALGRFNNTSAPTQSLAYNGGQITWRRGGTGPEITRATFDASVDGGSTWTSLGTPTRIAGGWQLSSVSAPNNASIRARGYLSGAIGGTSSWLVETNIGPLAIVQQPASRTNLAATLAALTVRVGGGATPSYQWLKNGTNLSNTINISGVTSPTLVLSNVFGGDSGAYSVVIADSRTTLTSQVATVTVLDPYFTTQPVSLTNYALSTATFNVAANGQTPLAYAWFKNGTNLADTANISGSQTPALTLSNVLGADAGSYWAVATNPSGSITSSVATLTVIDPYVTSQTTNLNVNPGDNTSITVAAFGTAPLTYYWWHKGALFAVRSSPTLNLPNVTAAEAGTYVAVISNAFGMVTSSVATVTVNFAAADSLNPGLTPYPGQPLYVASLAIQPDGEIIFGGSFNGPTGFLPSDLGLLNPDGSLGSFSYELEHQVGPGVWVTAGAWASAIACQTNGAFLIGGTFDSISTYPRPALARFNSDRSLDLSYNPAASNSVSCIALQPDNSLVVGGTFTNLAGQPRSRLARLLPSGALDTTFNSSADGSVNCLALQTDGKVLVGGAFQNLAGQHWLWLGRLNPNGTLDTSFNPAPNQAPNTIAVLPDGKILVGGAFTSIGGVPRTYLARLNADGSLDTSFNPTLTFVVNTLAVQTDGGIVVGGNGPSTCFPVVPLTRLNPDGSLDFTFNPCGTISAVYALAIQKDDEIVVGGSFTSLAGQPRSGIGRLINNSPMSATESIAFDSFSVTWLRSGTSTEIWRATFESSTDGANWTLLGDATRIAGGWQLSGLSIPANAIIRARGFVVGGNWFVETVTGLPELSSQPASRTNYASTTATFSVSGYGGSPLHYQWLKNGSPLSDGGNTSGALTTSLTLSNVLGADAAGYSIILSNSSGVITSSVAILTVIDPWFSTQPSDWYSGAGGNHAFTATVVGTTPLSYQWVQNGTNFLTDNADISGSQSPTLLLTNLTGFNAGNYQVIASNTWGSITSSVAYLYVADPMIYSGPTNASMKGGQTLTLSVLAAGVQPLAYQWRKGGVPLGTATNSFLTLSPIQGFDAGNYDVVVSDVIGSATTSVASVTVVDPFITANPTNQYVLPGGTVFLSVTAGGGSLLSYQWLQNGAPVPGATSSTLVITNAQGANAGYYTAVVTDNFSNVTSSVAAVSINTVGADSFSAAAGTVQVLALQPDQKILLAGNASPQSRVGPLVRLNPDASPDVTFVPGTSNNTPSCFAVQPDGKILVGGGGTAGPKTLFLWRLNCDGSIDNAFTSNLGSGPNGPVSCLALQPDGKILLGGIFSVVNGQSRLRLARLNTDGTLDTNFTATANNTVYSLAVQSDNAIIVAGGFTSLNGQPRSNIGRLLVDGSLDTNFNASANSAVRCLLLQPDAKILVAGNFTTLNGKPRTYFGRLNPDGTVDTNFVVNANNIIYSLSSQTDGRIVVGGLFTTLGGLNRNRIARVNPDGSLDLAFNPGAIALFDTAVYALGIQTDGAIIVGGQFTNLAGVVRTNIGRLVNTVPASQSLTLAAGTATWLRGGSSPEVWRTSFEASTNGVDWSLLGAGQRIPGGWQFAGLNPPLPRNLRARGFLSGSQSDGSPWFAETIIGPPAIDLQPLSRTNLANTTATFFVTAGGDSPLSYQWLKAGAPVVNGGNVSGATSPALVLSNVFGVDAGAYCVVITNGSGVITSAVAQLTVIEPLITRQPTNQVANAGNTVSFSVAAIGTAPINYQWLRYGTNIAAPNAATLTLSNLSRTDLGTYSVLVSTAFGSVLSSNATLTINLAVPDLFNPGDGDVVRVLAPQTDGKVLIGYDSSPSGGYPSQYLVRVNPDGSPDPSFNPGVTNNTVWCLARQHDGKLLVGGTFATVAGQSQACLARLNADDSFDSTFRPAIAPFLGTFTPVVSSVLLQPDGKIVVAGGFDSLAGGSSSNICRLNPDGTADTNFRCSVNGWVYGAALQPDGKILVGGNFTNVGGFLRSNIARINPDGTVDQGFNPGSDNIVNCFVVQPDGRILVAGRFNSIAGAGRSFLGRLNADGSIDYTFTAAANNYVSSLALQADGKILVGGFFQTLAGQPRSSLGRLNPDGSLDTTFFPVLAGVTNNVFTPTVESVALQADGTVLIGGFFTAVNGQPRASIARLTAGDPATQYLTSDGRSITWLRGGTSPELSRTTFETSADGTNWTMLGAGSRMLGGWRLSRLALPAAANLRARGFTTGAYFQSSGWLVENFAQVLSPAPTLVIDSSSGVFSNQFTFATRAVPGQVVVIEATEDFVHWIPVQTNVVTVSPAGLGTVLFNYTEQHISTYPRRFYRATLYSGDLPAPNLLAGSSTFSSNAFNLNLAGVRGQTVIIEASTDLAHWIPIATNSLINPTLMFSDAAATTFPYRFYRARLP